MKIIHAPHLAVHLGEPQPISRSELERYGHVEIADDDDRLIGDIVTQLVAAQANIVIGAEPEVEAPPFTPTSWWLATVRINHDLVIPASFQPRPAYGIDRAGLVHFAYPSQLPVADFIRAVDDGHYDTSEHTLVVTRAGEFGGNGHAISSLVLWLLQEFPMILLGVGVDRALVRRDDRRREELEDLAASWAAREIHYPMSLRNFVESKHQWFTSALAIRLGISEGAASRLLESLGYEASTDDPELFQYSDGPGARAARTAWSDAEWQPTFVSLDELLDSGDRRPRLPYEGMDAIPPQGGSRHAISAAREWVRKLLSHRRT